jgi:hypothetical protein
MNNKIEKIENKKGYEISMDALADKLERVRNFGVRTNFKHMDEIVWNSINNLCDDLNRVIEQYESENDIQAIENVLEWQKGGLINLDAINKMSLGDLERVSKMLEGVK